ncbi:sensor histidine kinase [Streptomyces sp. NPDC053431]|uniref:sensor histidine kinase n=1 Tax=Streptomyces sp. NPDC053431 TaxID=3365703 RepID=UPI0037D78744
MNEDVRVTTQDKAGAPTGIEAPTPTKRTIAPATAPDTATPGSTAAPVPATAPSRHLQRAPARVRAFDTAHPWVWDGALTAAWTVAALVDATAGWRTTALDPSVPPWLVVTTTLALALPLYWRRRHPVAALAAMAAGALVSTASGAFLQSAYLQTLPLFHIALNRPPRALPRSTALLALPLAAGILRFRAEAWDRYVFPSLWAYVLVALLGITVRSRREEREQEVRLAAAAERTRIAREMHDIIGHNLSVITGLADGGRYAAAKNPERAAQALDAIGTTSRQTLAELRRLLGVLREGEESDDPADRAPQPGLADLPALVEGVRKAGLRVHADLPPAPHPLSPGAQLTVYRVAQEALTNTMKHAGEGAEATVALTYAADSLSLTVTDTGGNAPDPAPGAARPGQGLAGMRERAALYDGTLECGPTPAARGWRVRLRLPREDSPS